MSKKLKRLARRRTARKHIERHSLILGLVGDVFFVLGLFTKFFAWPVHTLSRFISRESRKYPQLNFLHSHAFVSLSFGLVLILLSIAFESLSDHVVWKGTIEVAKAAGVCPIWEIIAAKLVRV